MPPLRDASMTAAQRLAVADVLNGPRGELAGNWAPLLRTPELMTRVQQLGTYLRFESVLDDDLRELAVLYVARWWSNDFEYAFHHPLALEAGLSASSIDDLANGRPPRGVRSEVFALWRLLDELHRTGRVANETYETGVALLGEETVIGALVTAGYYTTLAMVMNLAQTPPPKGPRLPARKNSE